MLTDLFERLLKGGAAPASPDDSRLAMAALMVRLARSDGSYSGAERLQIERFLASHYDVDARTVEEIMSEAEAQERSAPDTVRFTRIVKDAVPYEDRTDVVEALWRLAILEGIDANERSFLRLVSNLLGVSDQDSAMARQRVERDAR
jgi:uncharacterized tellurite resistance protein B-like protein